MTLADGGSLTSTSSHRFWNASERAWADASRLRAGDSLLTPSGQQATISATRQWEGLQAAYNLTVADLHTYYVLAGDTPVLVHNNNCAVTAVALGYQAAGTAKWAEGLGFTHFMKPEFEKTWRDTSRAPSTTPRSTSTST
ncbi:polymorphic toxin-type HINT domain-containing protein [Streptomyces sp. 1331.2]|uniref:polymorphic toxin-type HINT domain-containing protein n=1 Tax=Streptomyces sp. 1331.2 TaxID=1938835 RepID=UPI000BE2C652|nr:polymorphic toxin-type HINT domain-containing protein [Streptomyces sp. 1331.2]